MYIKSYRYYQSFPCLAVKSLMEEGVEEEWEGAEIQPYQFEPVAPPNAGAQAEEDGMEEEVEEEVAQPRVGRSDWYCHYLYSVDNIITGAFNL